MIVIAQDRTHEVDSYKVEYFMRCPSITDDVEIHAGYGRYVGGCCLGTYGELEVDKVYDDLLKALRSRTKRYIMPCR